MGVRSPFFAIWAHFMRLHEVRPFSHLTQVLWLHLVYKANGERWEKDLVIRWTEVALSLGLSERTVRRLRAELEARGVVMTSRAARGVRVEFLAAVAAGQADTGDRLGGAERSELTAKAVRGDRSEHYKGKEEKRNPSTLLFPGARGAVQSPTQAQYLLDKVTAEIEERQEERGNLEVPAGVDRRTGRWRYDEPRTELEEMQRERFVQKRRELGEEITELQAEAKALREMRRSLNLAETRTTKENKA